VGFNEIRDIYFLIPFEFALSTKEWSFLKAKAQDLKYLMFDNGEEEGTSFKSSQHHLYEMNLEHIRTMLEDSTMDTDPTRGQKESKPFVQPTFH
jgi:hypothetical protein